jgi:hypothetical protein
MALRTWCMAVALRHARATGQLGHELRRRCQEQRQMGDATDAWVLMHGVCAALCNK